MASWGDNGGAANECLTDMFDRMPLHSESCWDDEIPAPGKSKVAKAPNLKTDHPEPLEEKIDVTDEVAKLGYTSKFVSSWYLHNCLKGSCQSRWTEFEVVDDEEADLKKRTSDVPIIHRHEYVRKHWVTASVTVQDPTMRTVLAEVLKNYQDLDLDLEDWTFQPPFMPLVHRFQALTEYPANTSDVTLKSGASALLAFLTPILASAVLSLAQTRDTAKVNFGNVWQIFPPSSLVITKFFGVETVCRVVKYKQSIDEWAGAAAWAIEIEYVDWNGEQTGFATTELKILQFEGIKRVTALPVFPISFLEDAEKTKASMIQRGRKFEGLRGYNFMTSNGTKILLETVKQQRPVAGKVCVDAYAYYRSYNIVKPELRSLIAEKEGAKSGKAGENDHISYASEFSIAPVEFATVAVGPDERVQDLQTLTEEQCMMTNPWMKGFDLKSKDWCELRVDELKEIAWNDEALYARSLFDETFLIGFIHKLRHCLERRIYPRIPLETMSNACFNSKDIPNRKYCANWSSRSDKLVLPSGEKELAWEFVESKSLSKGGFDDYIGGKGKGLIILMFGPPGVGKTFTAEAVAERSRVPLYSMSAGDLGIKPAEVEKNLERALELCRMWNAMLLLDEADVFLGVRTNESLARNELVSIFLTKLEYYQGILFLTTNRIASIDHAFRSRVDMFLPYHDLTSEARRQVWDNFIDRAGREKFDVNDESMDKLSQLALNGREIKNLIKSAQLLGRKTGGKVPMDRLYMLAEKRKEALMLLDGSEE